MAEFIAGGGSRTEFAKADTDGDGTLDEDELAAHAAKKNAIAMAQRSIRESDLLLVGKKGSSRLSPSAVSPVSWSAEQLLVIPRNSQHGKTYHQTRPSCTPAWGRAVLKNVVLRKGQKDSSKRKFI